MNKNDQLFSDLRSALNSTNKNLLWKKIVEASEKMDKDFFAEVAFPYALGHLKHNDSDRYVGFDLLKRMINNDEVLIDVVNPLWFLGNAVNINNTANRDPIQFHIRFIIDLMKKKDLVSHIKHIRYTDSFELLPTFSNIPREDQDILSLSNYLAPHLFPQNETGAILKSVAINNINESTTLSRVVENLLELNSMSALEEITVQNVKFFLNMFLRKLPYYPSAKTLKTLYIFSPVMGLKGFECLNNPKLKNPFPSLETLHLNSLDMSECNHDLFLTSNIFENVQTLYMQNSCVTDQILINLFNNPYCQNLKHLYLKFNPITNLSLDALVASPFVKNLETLDLFKTDATYFGIKKLLNSPNGSNFANLTIGSVPRQFLVDQLPEYNVDEFFRSGHQGYRLSKNPVNKEEE